MKKEEVLKQIEKDTEALEKGKWTVPDQAKTLLMVLKYLVESQWPR